MVWPVRVDRESGKRVILWFIATLSILLSLYRHNALALLEKAIEFLSGNLGYSSSLGGLFLVSFFLLLRWGEFNQILSQERGYTSMLPRRLFGLAVTLFPLFFMRNTELLPRHQYLHTSTMIVLLVGYGATLIITPTLWKILLPYTALAVMTFLSPSLIQSTMGDVFVDIAAVLTRLFLDLSGAGVIWNGNEASFISKSGAVVKLMIDRGCSSIPSISIFLLLVGLMHLDQKKDLNSTLKLASLGTVALIIINSVKLAITLWAGKVYGSGALWSLHSWLGYIFFTGFYMVALLAYLRMSNPRMKRGEG